MIHKIPSPQTGHVRVVFELPSSVWANYICLSGDFNQWNERDLPMHQERDGAWRAEIDLPLGKMYQFHYIVDGQPQTDYHADGFSSTTSRAQKSIIDTGIPAHRAPQLPGQKAELLFQKAMVLREQFASRHRDRAYLPTLRETA